MYLTHIIYQAETTDVFSTSKDTGSGAHHDVNYDLVLRNCNAKLTVWADEWKHEIDRGVPAFRAKTCSNHQF